MVFAAQIPCELGFAPPGRAAQGPTSTLRAADPPALLRRKGLAASLHTRASSDPGARPGAVVRLRPRATSSSGMVRARQLCPGARRTELARQDQPHTMRNDNIN